MNHCFFRNFFFKGIIASKDGQLSLFAALIFQVLFILFAMSLNISLVIHDKINLQNSLDLAAYYGAMKQAEQLNTIAHINYQIRQSWKLLAWRYRVLGNLGGQPLYRLPKNPEEKLYLPQNRPGLRGIYSMCVGHNRWGKFYTINANSFFTTSRDQNLCMPATGTIAGLQIPTGRVTGGLKDLINISTPRAIRSASQRIKIECETMGLNSWLMTFSTLLRFRKDNSIRQYMIYKLAKNLSEGKDLEGKDILEGALKTFKKNLSFRNKKSFNPSNLRPYNSLGGKDPNQWLKTPHNPPYYMLYTDAASTPSGGCQKGFKLVNSLPKYAGQNQDFIDMIVQITFRSENPSLCKTTEGDCNPTAGIYKDQNMDVFYALDVELNYTGQIFSPITGPIKFKARSIAKPFGGRIGPPPGADKRIPTAQEIQEIMNSNLCRATNSSHSISLGSRQSRSCAAEVFSSHLGPDYSRYPGDELGLRSQSVQSFWLNYLNSQRVNNNLKDLNNYFNPNGDTQNPIIDPLARSTNQNNNTSALPARRWELAAIAPDLFDITYYSIFPSYMHTHYRYVKQLSEEEVPGDLGFSFNASPTNYNHLRYQAHIGQGGVWQILGLNSPPFYKITRPSLFLTGWNPPKSKYFSDKPSIYSPPHSVKDGRQINFGHCLYWDSGENKFWPGPKRKALLNACILGGRTGYSVKLISQNLVSDQLPNEWN